MHIVVSPTVSAADVIAGASDAELRDLECRIPSFEYVPDESRGEGIVRALLDVPLEEGDFNEWAEPYIRAGLSARWLDALRNLRIRNMPGFCLVRELERLPVDNRWWANGSSIEHPSAVATLEPRPATFALRLEVTHDRRMAGSRRSPQGVRTAPPRRPYPNSPQDARALEALATHLEPRVLATFGGKERLRLEPVLAAVCAMTASVVTVAAAVREAKPRGKMTWQLLNSCLDALDLGQHRRTAERVLVRDDAEHIHVDAPADLAPETGRCLGLFAEKSDGALIMVEAERRREHPPRVLYCLAAPEPV
jgi:hypothetical protein